MFEPFHRHMYDHPVRDFYHFIVRLSSWPRIALLSSIELSLSAAKARQHPPAVTKSSPTTTTIKSRSSSLWYDAQVDALATSSFAVHHCQLLAVGLVPRAAHRTCRRLQLKDFITCVFGENCDKFCAFTTTITIFLLRPSSPQHLDRRRSGVEIWINAPYGILCHISATFF